MIGFIGLGNMGAAMAANLIRKGHGVTVFARRKTQANSVLKAGAKWAHSPAQMATDCDIIFTILGGPKDVEALYLAPDGLLANATAGSVLVDMTTSSASLAQTVATIGQKYGTHILDAPVTGGVKGAKAGTLTFMIGGEDIAIDRVRPALKVMGSKVFHIGSVGAGQDMKACNQIAVAGILLGAAQAMELAQKQGISPDMAFQVLGSGTAASPLFCALWDRAQKDGVNTGFSVAQFAKDLRIAAKVAESGRETTLVTLALETFEHLESEGKGKNGLQILLTP